MAELRQKGRAEALALGDPFAEIALQLGKGGKIESLGDLPLVTCSSRYAVEALRNDLSLNAELPKHPLVLLEPRDEWCIHGGRVARTTQRLHHTREGRVLAPRRYEPFERSE